MNGRRARISLWPTVILTVAAAVSLAARADAENRLPANRTYLAFVQGIADHPLAGEFACLVFHRDGRLLVGDEDPGRWFISDRLSVSSHQRAVGFEITVDNDDGDPPGQIRVDGLCWLDDLGPTHSLACSAHAASSAGLMNLAITARPLGGGTSAAARTNCQNRADRWNDDLGN